MERLKIIYRDEGGYVEVAIPYDGIDFVDGEAYFTDGDKDYRIKLDKIMRIGLSF